MKIIFMGTPSFAVASLNALYEQGFEIVAVITMPDKPVGRGQKMSESAVKQYALSKNLFVLQPEKLRDPNFIQQLKSLNADLQVVVAFRMLPEVVWSMPKLGTINLHGSLLPQYRGAAPINWAIINGETETGVTTFFIEKEIDTGAIIFSEKTVIGKEENAGELHDRMMEIGSKLVVKTALAIEKNEFPQIPQNFDQELKSAPKIFKETCLINWEYNSLEVFNFVRGLSPYPTAWTYLQGKILKVYEVSFWNDILDDLTVYSFENNIAVLTDHKKTLLYKTSDGYLAIKTLQLEGKKRMSAEELLRGFRF